MTDAEFRRQFEAGETPLASFRHVDHIRLAWIYLQTEELSEAMILFRDALKKFAALHGKHSLYHETITFAFMILIHERMDPGSTWSEFSSANRDLIENGKEVLSKLYRDETLASQKAREIYVPPDRI